MKSSQLNRRDEQKKIASDFLKVADKHLKAGELEKALNAVLEATGADPGNFYALAYRERINDLINKAKEKKETAQVNESPKTVEDTKGNSEKELRQKSQEEARKKIIEHKKQEEEIKHKQEEEIKRAEGELRRRAAEGEILRQAEEARIKHESVQKPVVPKIDQGTDEQKEIDEENKRVSAEKERQKKEDDIRKK